MPPTPTPTTFLPPLPFLPTTKNRILGETIYYLQLLGLIIATAVIMALTVVIISLVLRGLETLWWKIRERREARREAELEVEESAVELAVWSVSGVVGGNEGGSGGASGGLVCGGEDSRRGEKSG